jgi:hypothetical protein
MAVIGLANPTASSQSSVDVFGVYARSDAWFNLSSIRQVTLIMLLECNLASKGCLFTSLVIRHQPSIAHNTTQLAIHNL